MDFLDWQAELALLRDHLTRPGAGLFVLYGRRRIGKTALLAESLKGVPRAAYHVATRSTQAEELARLSLTLAEAWDVPLLSEQPLATPEALLALLRSQREPCVLALDEFPYLAESAPALPGLLQAAWDRHLAQGPLKLLCCGSSVGMMEQLFLSERAPLFGRRTGQLRLGPLPEAALAEAFGWRAPALVELMAVFGGVPGYLQRLDPRLDLWANLETRVLRRGEPLYEELPFLLREELREPRVYQAILAAISGGASKFGEISSKVGLERSNLMKYLGVLVDLGLVEREVPVVERTPDKSRKGRYRVADPFVASWFLLVHPFRDVLERGAPSREVLDRIRARLAEHLPRAIEPVLRDMLRSPPWSSAVPFEVAHAGRQWSPAAELDVVLMDAGRRRAFVAEIKWTRRKVGRELLDDLRARVALEPALRGCERTYALVSREGFTGRRPLGKDERLLDPASPP